MPKTTKKTKAGTGSKEKLAKAKLDRLEQLLESVEEAAEETEGPIEPEVVEDEISLEDLAAEAEMGDAKAKHALLATIKANDLLLKNQTALPKKGMYNELHDKLRGSLETEVGKQAQLAAILDGLMKQETQLMEHAAVNLAAKINEKRSLFDGDLGA